MNIHVNKISASEVQINIEGTLDAVTAPDARATFDQVVLEAWKDITLELSALRLIDSSGVGVIVSLFKRVRAYNGTVRIVGLRDQPRAIFRLLRLDRVFPM